VRELRARDLRVRRHGNLARDARTQVQVDCISIL
jgi:hypothetical protein